MNTVVTTYVLSEESIMPITGPVVFQELSPLEDLLRKESESCPGLEPVPHMLVLDNALY